MGITPIFNLIPLPQARSAQGKLDALPMERVENASKAGSDSCSYSGGRTARGSEDGASDEDPEFELDEDEVSSILPSASGQPRAISFFA